MLFTAQIYAWLEACRKIWEIALTNEIFVTCYTKPLLAEIYGVVELHRLIFLEFAFGMEDGVLQQDRWVSVLLRFLTCPVLWHGAVPLAVLWL